MLTVEWQKVAMEELREIAEKMVSTGVTEDEFLTVARQAFEDAEVAAEDEAEEAVERDAAYREEDESAPRNEPEEATDEGT
jgi:RNA-splicing ligase RtcB